MTKECKPYTGARESEQHPLFAISVVDHTLIGGATDALSFAAVIMLYRRDKSHTEWYQQIGEVDGPGEVLLYDVERAMEDYTEEEVAEVYAGLPYIMYVLQRMGFKLHDEFGDEVDEAAWGVEPC